MGLKRLKVFSFGNKLVWCKLKLCLRLQDDMLLNRYIPNPHGR